MKTLTEKQYIEGLLNNNPLDHILPITHKNNHGINKRTWYKVLKELGYNVHYHKYQHRFYSAEKYWEETKFEIIVTGV